MRVIIPAAGAGSRWNNFRGTDKHLTVVEGQVLINRTINQFSKFTNDIVVISKNKIVGMMKVNEYVDSLKNII